MEQNLDDDFIELNRSFHEMPKWANDSDNHDLTQTFSVGPALSWPDLIANFRTIILSEAGSGKTAEIRHQAEILQKAGKPSFFLRLENVAQDFEIAFEVGNPEAFAIWLDSMEEGWIFLDSVDEARLKSPGDFQISIKHMGRRLIRALDRTHIVITGRSSAWRARSDYALCADYFPIQQAKVTSQNKSNETSDFEITETEKDASQSRFKIVTLDSLSNGQIEIFARRLGIADTRQFLAGIERADAAASTLRPQDLAEVILFWKRHKRVGTRFELMQFSIDQRIVEHDPNRGLSKPLAPQIARKAAKLVAAGATLAKTQTILLPDHEPGLPGVNLDYILPEWNAQEQATLLSRPIFDEAIYGSVRFYHRTVREYLTAEWLSDLLRKQTSRQKIYQILFRNQYGIDVIPPTMRPILSWLVLFDDDVLDRVLRISPELVLEGGDPARLPIHVRKRLLNDICGRVSTGRSGRTIYDYGAVQRFASSDIAEEVSKLLGKYRCHEDISWFLLRMVWIGELAACLPQARKFALDPKAPTYNRIAAFKAIEAIGTNEEQADLREKFAAERDLLRREWIAALLVAAPYTPETIKWLLRCLDRAQANGRHSSDQLQNELGPVIA